ncbi:MAG: hypothetical protein ACE5I1_19410, partial [bacterium]
TKAHRIPLIDCNKGERKHLVAEPYIPKDAGFVGVFLILVGRAPGPVWEVQRSAKGKIFNIEKKTPYPYVNHYSFHIMDPEWGHLIIKICGHPPFGAQIIFNGHEYVARQATKLGIGFTKDGNCFTHISNAQRLAQIADTLSSVDIIGRLSQVCQRWIYSSCLCFALDLAEQERSDFRYSYSVFQAEYSRNLLFTKGECVLRIEIIIHNARALPCGRSLEKFPEIISHLRSILNRFLDNLRCIDVAGISDGRLDELPTPSQVGKTRIGGVDINKPRMRAVTEAVTELAVAPRGFTSSMLAAKVQERIGQGTLAEYSPRKAACDLKKLRGKNIIRKIKNSRRYETVPEGFKAMAALLVLREKVIKPVIAGASKPKPGPKPKNQSLIDVQYRKLQLEMRNLFQIIGIAV